MAWLVLGVPVFLVQHWWIYTYAMFLVPVGIFAGHGLDTIVQSWPRLRAPARGPRSSSARRRCSLPPAVSIARHGRDVARHGFALSTEDRAALRRGSRAGLQSGRAPGPASSATPGAPKGGVYVLGNPLDLYLADRTQSVSINGWSPEQYPDDVWHRIREELKQARPVAARRRQLHQKDHASPRQRNPAHHQRSCTNATAEHAKTPGTTSGTDTIARARA